MTYIYAPYNLWFVDESLKAKLLDKAWVGQQLREFRLRHGFGQVKALQEKTKLTGLGRNEDGSQFPGWETLVKMADACGKNVSDFFQFLEPPKTHRSGVEIVPGYERIYGLLTTILTCKNLRRIEGITVNLEEFAAASERELAASEEDKHQARGSPLKQRRESSR